MIHQVFILPAGGFSDEQGAWSGATVGRYSETGFVDAVVAGLVEELEKARVRYTVAPTRKHPGMTPDQRFAAIEPGAIVVSVRAGAGKEGARPQGIIHYATERSLHLAQLACEGMRYWGQTVDPDYQVRSPRLFNAPHLSVPNTHGIEIEPVALSARGADGIGARLVGCGASIGWAVAEWLRLRPNSCFLGGVYRGLGVALPAPTS